MLCPNCETENRDGAKFCDECGFPLKQVEPEEPNQDVVEENLPEQETLVDSETPSSSDEQPSDQPDAEQLPEQPAPEATAELNIPESAPTDQPQDAKPESEEAADDFTVQNTVAIGVDLAGFDRHADDYGERLVDSSYKAPEPSFRDGGTMQMPRIDSDEAPKSRDYLASSTKEKQRKGKFIAIAIAAVVVLAAVCVFASYQMQMWGGKVVPDVTGMTEADARSVLADQGFEVVSQQVKSDDTEGLVLIEDPSAGSRADEGSQVVIHLATARTIPEITGKTKDDAAKLLAEAGYESVKFEEKNSDKPKGTVLSVEPKEGERAKSSAEVNVKIAKPYTVPDVAGKSVDEAIRALEKAGLGYEAVDYDTNEYPEGTVVSSEPAAGTEVKKGYYVVINVAQSRGTKLEELASNYLQPGTSISHDGTDYTIESVDSVSYTGGDTVAYTVTARPYTMLLKEKVELDARQIDGTITFNSNDEIASVS